MTAKGLEKEQRYEKENRSVNAGRCYGIPAKRTHDFDTYYISWEDYLRMVTVVCFKDNTEV